MLAEQADRARAASAMARVRSRWDANSRLGGVRYGVEVAYDAGESLGWRLAEPSILAPQAEAARLSSRVAATEGRGHQRRSDSEGHPVNDPDARDYDSPEDWAAALATWSETQPYFGLNRGDVAAPPCDPTTGAVDSEGRFTCPGCWESACPTQGSCDGPSVNARESLCSSPASVFEFFHTEIDPVLLALWRETEFLAVASTVREVLAQAWCMILENLDLVEWAARLAIGPAAAEWIRLLLAEGWFAVRLRFIPSAWFDAFRTGTLYFTVPGNFILANPGIYVWESWTTLWNTGRRAARTCAVVDAASILFHELCHYSGAVLADWGEKNCQNGAAYAAGDTFQLALLHRYPRAMEEECCASTYGDDDSPGERVVDDSLLFMSLGSFAIESSCA